MPETNRTLRFNRIPRFDIQEADSPVEQAVREPPREPQPIDDTVFPSEVYATAEPNGWANPSQQDFVPVIQSDLNAIQVDRRVAVYVLKEIKQLKIVRELV